MNLKNPFIKCYKYYYEHNLKVLTNKLKDQEYQVLINKIEKYKILEKKINYKLFFKPNEFERTALIIKNLKLNQDFIDIKIVSKYRHEQKIQKIFNIYNLDYNKESAKKL